MKTSGLDCLAQAARAVLAPHGIKRVSVLGDITGGLPSDLHLLVEFEPGARPIALGDWLRLQRQMARVCAVRVELVAVIGLEEQVAQEYVARTVVFEVDGQDA